MRHGMCGPGFFADSFGEVNCTGCSPGSYANASGMSGCVPCVGGTFGNVSAMSACNDCSFGTVSTMSATVCQVPHTSWPSLVLTHHPRFKLTGFDKKSDGYNQDVPA
eukprot:2827494-Rhodomonas_salina.1